ncbi:MAG: MerR family DNA-binding transcriptional regulator [Pseudonocardia sp.]|nr:MerR family DNA-binding transcriptional regulator [Pseudonocardia sp.]
MASRLVPTGDAARELGVNIRTLQHWASEGLVTPDVVTPGGHMRWDVERLRAQLRDLPPREER